ncbi:MAG: type II secretion system F family protein [Rhodospirillaceae bacterium]
MEGSEPVGMVALAAALAVSVIVLLLLTQFSQARASRQVRARVAGVRARRAVEGGRADAMASVRKESGGSYPALEALARRIVPRPALLRDRLAQAGLGMGLGQYVLCCLAVGIAFTLLRSLAFHLPLPVAVLLGIVSGLGLPHFAVSVLIARRIRRFLADFPEAIDLIIRGLRSGLPVPESIRIVGLEFGGPVGAEFAQISDRIRFGEVLEDALWDAAKRIDQPDFKFFVVSLSVQRETGGNLAETLENLSDILRRRRQMKLKIRAMSSEARASAMILGSLPFLMFAVLWAINGPYVMTLFTDPRGIAMVGFAFACLAVGIGVMWKMVRFEI